MKLSAILALVGLAMLLGCPTPTPGPTPTPATKLIIVYESSTATTTQLDVLASEKLRSWLQNRNIWFRFIDRDILDPKEAPPDEVASFILRAAKKPSPWMMVASAFNAILDERSLPATDDATIAILEPIAHRK